MLKTDQVCVKGVAVLLSCTNRFSIFQLVVSVYFQHFRPRHFQRQQAVVFIEKVSEHKAALSSRIFPSRVGASDMYSLTIDL